MRKNILFFICFCFFTAKTQTLQLPKNIQSPNAASIGKYGDVPMDLYTGRANVNIPLYSINEGGIPLDISLSYDTGGVRVNDVPGWVGQNWTFNAGGVITRSQRGFQFDECKNKNQGLELPTGFMFYKSDLNTSDWNTPNKIKNLIENYLTHPLWSFKKDYEPDIFTFNFMGYSGKFFLGNDGEWKVISSRNLKIEINEADYIQPLNIINFGNSNPLNSSNTTWVRSKVIGKIKITDDQGNYFIFGKNQNDIEFTIPSYDHQSELNLFSNAWYLSEVYNKYNSKIYTFSYERGNDQVSLYNTAAELIYNRESCWKNGILYPSITYNPVGGEDMNMKFSGTIIKPVFLQTITTKSGNTVNLSSENHNSQKYSPDDPIILKTLLKKQEMYSTMAGQGQSNQAWDHFKYSYWYTVHNPINSGDPLSYDQLFNTGDYLQSLKNLFQKWQWRKLNTIVVKNSKNDIIKQISFSYNNGLTKRLKLEKVVIDQLQKYSFDYYNFDSLPTFTSKSFDHFGYFSGRNYADALVDKYSHYSNRETDSEYVKYGLLTKITYPTGGSTTFEYEPHSYSSYVSNDRTSLISESGSVGVRIKKTTDNSKGNGTLIKEYLYQNTITNSQSNGILLLKNTYFIQGYPGATTCGSTFYTNSFSLNSIVPLSNFSGTYIEYPVVIERSINAQGNPIGYNKYSYYTFSDYKDTFAGTVQPAYSIFDPKTEFNFKRGSLRLKQIYNSGNEILREEEYLYNSNNVKKSRALGYDFFGLGITTYPETFDGNPAMRGNAYEIYYSDNNLVGKELRIYDDNGNFIRENESFNYIDRENFGDTFLRSKERTISTYPTLKEEYQYTFDKGGIAPYTTLKDKRDFSVLKTEQTSGSTILSSKEIEYTLQSIYTNNAVETAQAQVFPQKISESKGNNSLEDKLTIDKYDADGNILQAHKQNGQYVFYFYGYNNRYPIMKIEGPKDLKPDRQPFSYYAAQLRTLQEATSPNLNQITTTQFYAVSSYPEHMVTCYTFKPDVGVTSVMKPNASIEYYNYDSIGRLINIKDFNGKLLKDFSYELANQ